MTTTDRLHDALDVLENAASMTDDRAMSAGATIRAFIEERGGEAIPVRAWRGHRQTWVADEDQLAIDTEPAILIRTEPTP